MSGEIGYLLALPLALVAVPVVLGGVAIAAVGKAGALAVDAAVSYENKKRAEREEIYRSGIRDEIVSYRSSIKSMMTEQTKLNKELSLSMEEDLKKSREAFAQLISKMDLGEAEFAEEVQNASRQLMEELQEKQQELQVNYHTKIDTKLKEIEKESREKYEDTMADIQALQDTEEKKIMAQAKIARSYIEETRDLITALETQFMGAKYAAGQLGLHKSDLKLLEKQYNDGHYEGCMVAAVSLMAKVRQDILLADEKHQEFENWQKMAAMFIAENKGLMASQKVLTKELYDLLMEEEDKKGESTGITEEDIGTELSVYWGRTMDGKSVYEEMERQLKELEACVLAENCTLSAKELQEICEKMSGQWRVQIMNHGQKALECWNRALQRESLAMDIIPEMEKHGYRYNEQYAYIRVDENGDSVKVSETEKDAQLCLKFIDGYGDEILVRLYDTGGSKIGLQITDMAEELDPEIDKSETRRQLEEEIHAIVEGEDYQGTAKGGCQKGTERKVVANKKTKKISSLI